MTYNEWFEKQGKLHADVMKKLVDKSVDEVIEYFRFENMVKNEPDFCPLYKENKKCHDYEELNCYLCACPNFRFKDEGFEVTPEGKTLYSTCGINSKDGSQYIGDDYIHQNCSGCIVPHREKYIKKHFSRNWFEVMNKVRCDKGN
ncbi:hypothetical protein GCM10012288_24000 [Malaciobacter pacificus]|uniref:Uncharacterized protein n=1 Tax=Malaciobacter pacificus TaxID=1080223 RepID=A0A5C2HAR7_9BACT|nr:hypothetical protein [Malaciobacter pacificus]QEP35459.1 hypothetical protein APAC_2404 [Malaciobacter pacificus]GGD49104.1 hypothetical protein GCM10012288_24000 [Malaciobacter pacificus]